MSGKVALNMTSNKAGMNVTDKERIAQIVYEASKDSDYFKREQARSKLAEDKAKLMMQRIADYKSSKDGAMFRDASRKVEEIMQNLEDFRDLSRTWMHIDMDMFYAAVEIRDDPSLANIPIAIGSEAMISTANYEARKYGVRSAMPGFIGKKLCPQLKLIPCNMRKYAEVAKVFRDIIEQYDANFESLGLDEAHLDVTDYCEANEIRTDEEK